MSAPLALRALVVTLAHFGWQGALLALLLGVALRALRRASPEARYAAAGAALAAMAAAPVVTFVLVGRGLVAAAAPIAAAHLARPAAADPVSAVVAAAWGAGVVVMFVRLAGGALRLRAMVGRGTELPAAWRAMAERVAARLGVDRAVRVLASNDVDVPIALGWLRPAVLLPAALVLEMPASAVEALLAHELAHVRRHDWALNVVQSVVEALLFYHPAVWWVSSCLRAEREHCCDDAVVALTGDALGYARALVSLETTRTEAAALGVAATGGSLMTRIERMVNGSPAPRARRVGLAHAVVVAAALLAFVTAPLVSCASPAQPLDPAAAALPATVTRWTPSFVAAGQRHGVDPDLLAVVTLVESGGDPDATSPMGAVGLMQMMPATASSLAAERGLADVSTATLRDPDVNLDFGAFYLAAQLREFGAGQEPERAVELAAAAYNGGERAVRAYLTEGKPLSDETMAYKDRVVALWRERRAEGR